MAALLAVVAALYFGQQIFVPLALAILISFALAPIVVQLSRWGLGRVPSVIMVVILVFAALFGFGSVVTSQVVDLADNLPAYETNIRGKIQSFQTATPSGGLLDRTSEMLSDLRRDFDAATKGPSEGTVGKPSVSGEPDDVKPIPVEIRNTASSPMAMLRRIAGPILGPLGTAGIVLVFVIFILLERASLRDRLIRLVGTIDVRRTTTALDDAGYRVSRYLLMQLAINVLYGVPVAVGLFFIGVPNPLLWGLLATVLRFVPYVGPVVAALFPITLSFAVAPGWMVPLLTVGLFVMLELFSNNVIEPWLYGSSTGLSPTAIIVAAVFWVMLWGPVGLLLATPLTVCLVVLGRHVPQLSFLDVALGNEPVLPADVKFYQRILARDPDEAAELADEYLDEKPLEAYYEGVVMSALALAEQDRMRGILDRQTVDRIAEDTLGVIDYLAGEHGHNATAAGEETPTPTSSGIMCIGARNGLDEAAAAMLAHLFTEAGIVAKAVSREEISLRNFAQMKRNSLDMICLFYVNPAALQHASRLVKRLRQHYGGHIRIMVALWSPELPQEERRSALATVNADFLAVSLRGAIEQVQAQSTVAKIATATSTTPYTAVHEVPVPVLQPSG